MDQVLREMIYDCLNNERKFREDREQYVRYWEALTGLTYEDEFELGNDNEH